jgi:hypothetical protein
VASAHRGLAMCLKLQGTLEEALAKFDAAFRLARDDHEFLNFTAWDLVVPAGRARPEYEMGLKYSRKSLEVKPNEGDYLNTLALAEYRVGR